MTLGSTNDLFFFVFKVPLRYTTDQYLMVPLINFKDDKLEEINQILVDMAAEQIRSRRRAMN